MVKLSVNVNKIATLRNSRGKNLPDLVQVAIDIISFGAQGITVHPRPDGRHIRFHDVYELAEALKSHKHIEFNIEGYPSDAFMQLIEAVKPAQCTLVPDPPEALTSNAGWNINENVALLQQVAKALSQWGVRSSFFVDPAQVSAEELALLRASGAERIELYTERYAELYSAQSLELSAKASASYVTVAKQAHEAGLGVNAGHDLNQTNLAYFARHIPHLAEVSIGHALICESLYEGLQTTVGKYIGILAQIRG